MPLPGPRWRGESPAVARLRDLPARRRRGIDDCWLAGSPPVPVRGQGQAARRQLIGTAICSSGDNRGTTIPKASAPTTGMAATNDAAMIQDARPCRNRRDDGRSAHPRRLDKCRIPTCEPRIPNPESRIAIGVPIPNPESRVTRPSAARKFSRQTENACRDPFPGISSRSPRAAPARPRRCAAATAAPAFRSRA